MNGQNSNPSQQLPDSRRNIHPRGNLRNLGLLAAGVFFATLPTACRSPQVGSGNGGPPLAKMGDYTFTQGDFDLLIEAQPPERREAIKSDTAERRKFFQELLK